MLDFHRQRGADVTVSAIETSLEEARRYGIMRINPEGRIIGFQEKPVHPIPIPGKPDRALCNMGVYVFETDALVRAVMVDAKESAHHDFGKDVLPRLVKDGARIYAYNYQEAQKNAYWRDIGTLDSYFEASMDLVSANPLFNLHDPDWLIRTYPRQFPPAKTVFAEEHAGGRFGTALHSLVSPGCIISGGKVVHSVLSYNVRINSYALVTESILLEGVSVGRHTHLRRCVVDEGAKIPDNVSIGLEAKDDGAHFTVTDSGVVVVPSNYQWH
jgi:glucose-1-phosphate adenylyltransferase